MRQPFCILVVLGDLLEDGELRLIETVVTVEDARSRVDVTSGSSTGSTTTTTPPTTKAATTTSQPGTTAKGGAVKPRNEVRVLVLNAGSVSGAAGNMTNKLRALGYQLDPPPPGYDSWEAWLRDQGIPESEWNSASAVSDPACDP